MADEKNNDGGAKYVAGDGTRGKSYKFEEDKNVRPYFPYISPVVKKEQIIITEDKEEYKKSQEKTLNDENYIGKGKIVVWKPKFL